jgi:hypothetical protein
MAQNRAKLNGEKGDAVGVASDAVASINSPYLHRGESLSIVGPFRGRITLV